MKKIYLLFLLLLTFSVSSMAQALPKPAMPEISEFIDYDGSINLGYEIAMDFDGNLVGDDYTLDKYFAGEEYTILDPEKVSFSIYTDNNQIFTFTPEMFPDMITEPMTQIPYTLRVPEGNIGYWDIHFNELTTMGDNPFFTWRIGIQTIYTDGGQSTYSDIMYREIYPQLQEAKNVTSTSFVADWSCDYPNTYTINNFLEDNTPDVGYNLYVVNVETQETIVVNKVNPTNWTTDEWGYAVPLAGATYTVEGLTPGATYQFYVVVKQNTGVTFQSVVREVTLPLPPVAPVMLPADEEYVTSTSFRADWTDETDPALVQDYTLYVNSETGPQTLLTETFGGVTAVNDGTVRIESDLDTYCDNAGWTGAYVYQAGGGGLKFGNSSNGGGLTTPDLDLTDCNGSVTVTFTAKNYGTDATTVTVSCGEVSQAVELTSTATEYSVTLEGVPAAADQQISLMSNGNRKRWYAYDVNVSAAGASETLTFTNITDKYYVVENLTPGTTYSYYVVANYIDDTNAASNVEEVTLPEAPEHFMPGDVNHDQVVDVNDVTMVIGYILGSDVEICTICADVFEDNEVDVADVTAIIEIILSAE